MSPANRVLILGGGFGGVAGALRLRTLLAPEDEIALVDRRTHFFMGFRKNLALAGREPLEAGARPLAALEAKGIRVLHASVDALDTSGLAAEVGGQRIEADALLVALGADLAPEAIPGLTDHALNVYGSGDLSRAAEALGALPGDARLLIGIFGAPYKCPPAPFELAILLQEAARKRGTPLSVEVFSPLPMSLPVLGQATCNSLEGRLEGLGIGFRPGAKAERVDAGAVHLAGGERLGFDLLLAVPPHRAPAVLVHAGLAQAGGWVRVDPATMQTPVEGVWAVGDCVAVPMASGQPMPKAGVFAEAAGTVAAERIAARLAGRESDARFDGEGGCFLEVGRGEAMLVRGRFLDDPPAVELTDPSPEHLEGKARYERERLDAWFGPG